jgi:hypothetical protein
MVYIIIGYQQIPCGHILSAIVTQTLALTAKSVNVTLHLPSGTAQSLLLKSEL